MKKILASAILVVAALTVTGCTSQADTTKEYYQQLGEDKKACHEAGGVFEYDAWNGHWCNFEDNPPEKD